MRDLHAKVARRSNYRSDFHCALASNDLFRLANGFLFANMDCCLGCMGNHLLMEIY
jgi:hypothetical protein